MKGIFGVLALGNEKPKGMPDVWMIESKRTGSGAPEFRNRKCSGTPRFRNEKCSGTPRFQNGKCSGAPGFRNGKCSGAPGFRNGKYSGIPGANVKRPVQVLQDSETEKCLQVGCHWKVKMIRAGYLTLIDFGILIDLEFPPSSFSLGFG
ncbi:unnamed protein product [Rhizophagus irregularis]|nr:unnamed protein product [Rhizophagus irregularis]